VQYLEEASFIGGATSEIISDMIKDIDGPVFDILVHLGSDLTKVIEAYNKILSYVSISDFYSELINMVSDASKLIYDYNTFPPKRLEYLTRLRSVHGGKLLEFLDYLISRDKYMDKIGFQSDLIVLHYKFGSNSFVPKIQTLQTKSVDQAQPTPQKTDSPPVISYAQLSKMGDKEKAQFLREQKKTQKSGQVSDQKNVPADWPLPKEERLGKDSLDDAILTPQEFSRNLVGGRGAEF
jgi:hypothetical protein